MDRSTENIGELYTHTTVKFPHEKSRVVVDVLRSLFMSPMKAIPCGRGVYTNCKKV